MKAPLWTVTVVTRGTAATKPGAFRYQATRNDSGPSPIEKYVAALEAANKGEEAK